MLNDCFVIDDPYRPDRLGECVVIKPAVVGDGNLFDFSGNCGSVGS